MVEWFHSIPDIVPIIIDNNSTYPPLIEWLQKAPCEVVRLPRNYGWQSGWITGTILLGNHHRKRYASDFYAYTDPDLDFSNCPTDVFDVLKEGLNRHKDFVKCGVSLEINDVPATPWFSGVPEWEQQFWEQPLDDQYFKADTSTTLALYDCDKKIYLDFRFEENSLRSNRPYVARHLPWYVLEPTEEDYHYHLSIKQYTHWSSSAINQLLLYKTL